MLSQPKINEGEHLVVDAVASSEASAAVVQLPAKFPLLACVPVQTSTTCSTNQLDLNKYSASRSSKSLLTLPASTPDNVCQYFEVGRPSPYKDAVLSPHRTVIILSNDFKICLKL